MTSLMTLNRHENRQYYAINASLKSEATSKLINTIQGSRLLILNLPGSASRTHVESLGKPHDSTNVLSALPGKLDIKRHSTGIPYILTKSTWKYV